MEISMEEVFGRIVTEKLEPISKSLNRLIEDIKKQDFNKKDKIWLTIEEAAELLNLQKSTLYSLSSQGKIPYHKRGKKNIYHRDEVTEWDNTGRPAENCATAKLVDDNLEQAQKKRKLRKI